MKNLINFFFSFDKLMKEKLILPFFWLAVITAGLWFFAEALDSIALGVLAKIVNFFEFFVRIVFALVSIRLICELVVAIFRINDNLSPDGGKSETADIDPMVEARNFAEAAADRARDAAKIAGEKTQAATKSARESMSGKVGKSTDKTSDTSSVETASGEIIAKAPPSRNTAPKNPVKKSKRVKPPIKSTAKAGASKVAAAPKKAASKTSTRKPITRKAASAAGKRGPKAGVKVRRDAQGRMLKKDGTLRAKPGPKA